MDFGFIDIIFCLGVLAQITLGKIVQIDNDVTYDNGGTQWFSTFKKRPIDAFLGMFLNSNFSRFFRITENIIT